MVPVSRAVGRKRALELLLTGEPITATTACEWGLINRVVPAEQLDASVQQLVDAVARSSRLTVGVGKEAFYTQIDLDGHRAYQRRYGTQLARGGRTGGHLRLPREAAADVDRPLAPPGPAAASTTRYPDCGA
jgi:enoyl-CoA hydratase/carnithine racemase